MRMFWVAGIWIALGVGVSCMSQARTAWEKLVPGVSTCSEVKAVLHVSACDPIVRTRDSDKEIVVHFQTKSNSCLPQGAVADVLVIFNNRPRLQSLVPNLHGYKARPPSDTPDLHQYENTKTGWTVSVQVGSDGISYVTDVLLNPFGPTYEMCICAKSPKE